MAATTAGFAAVLEYTGATGLTVIGPASGHRYRFAAQGARVAVATGDLAGLLTVPTLRRAV